MVLRAIAAVMVLLSAAPQSVAAGGGPVVLYYVQRPPFMGRDAKDNLAGVLIPPVAAAFAKAGIPVVWSEASPLRQVTIIQSNAVRACSIGRYKTPERAAFAKFSVPYYQDSSWVGLTNVAFNAADHVRAADLMADPHVTVLIKDDIKFGPYVDNLIAHMKARRVGSASDYDQLIRMIQARRADFTLISGEEETYYRDKLGLTDKDFKIIHFSDMPAGEKRYLMCSKLVEDAEMERINAGLLK